MNGNTIDLTGQVFGKLTVIKYDHRNKHGAHWLCKCECGGEKVVPAHSLKTQHTTSCGCLYFSANNQSQNKAYKVWRDMMTRCYRVECQSYHNYGGRGIKVCEEWKESFESFINWSIQTGYKSGLMLDRINNDGDYEPNNCKWSTCKEQQNNKRTNRYIEYEGKKQSISSWADELGISYQALLSRITRDWPIEKAFFKPVQIRRKPDA